MLSGVIAVSVPFLLGGLWLGNLEGRVNSHDQRITVVEAAPVAIGKLEENQANMLRQMEKVEEEILAARKVQEQTLAEVVAAREKLANQNRILEKIAP